MSIIRIMQLLSYLLVTSALSVILLAACGDEATTAPEATPPATAFPTANAALTTTVTTNPTPSPSPLATRPTSSEAEERYANGVALGEQARWEEAISEFNETIRLDPQYDPAYLYRGGAYFRLGQFERAIQDFDEAVRLNPQLAEAYVGRGVAYTVLGRDSEAQQDADRAVELGFDLAVLRLVFEEAKEHR